MRVVLAGGGTAGHVNPAIALAQALRGDAISFIGTSAGAEAVLVPAAGLPFHRIEVRGFDRSKPLSFPATGAIAARAVRSAHRLLRSIAPDVVVGLGGYVSLPVSLAARALRLPVVVHEQNIVFGLANRVCRRFAQRVAVSFSETLPEAGPRGVLVGNPVRAEVAAGDMHEARESGRRRWGLDPARRTLLAFGGSQGALRINQAAEGLRSAWRHRSDRQVVHIAGRSAPPAEEDPGGDLLYRRLGFVDHMIDAYAVADLALCRGGASTVAELAVAGLPSVIVPYPHHRDRQQERLGHALARAGSAVVVSDGAATTDRVAAVADGLLGSDAALARMREAALAFAVPDAAARLAEVVRSAAA